MPTTGAPRDLRRDAQRNQDQLVRAATTVVHRDGLTAPLATIATEAGVGIGTLYRHFPSRAALLDHLTHRSFEQVLRNVQAAERDGETATDSLRLFVEAAISQRNDLVLPLHGGPPLTAPATVRLRAQVHRTLKRIVDRGVADGSLRRGVSPRDVVVLGALLAQPRPPDAAWDATCRRLLGIFLAGVTKTDE